eukprot:403352853
MKSIMIYQDGNWKKIQKQENSNNSQSQKLQIQIVQKPQTAQQNDLFSPQNINGPSTQSLLLKTQQDFKIRAMTTNNPAFVYDANVLDYTQIYKNFYDIFMIPHIQNRMYSKAIPLGKGQNNFKDVKTIIQENYKLYSTFSQLIFQTNHEESFNQSINYQTMQGISEKADFKIDQLVDLDRQPDLYFRVVKEKSEVYDIITLVFGRQFGDRWRELPHGVELTHSWNLLWTWSKIKSSLDNLLVWQKFNHFPENKNITRKDLLKKNIEKVQKISKKSKQVFDIIPLTFILPQEYSQLLTAFHQGEKEDGPSLNYWIVKPPGKSRGRGIHVVNDSESFKTIEPLVVQKYLKNPMLINGHKFDMRIYVLVTSFNPLECFIYKEGLARFSTVPFSLDPQKMTNRLIHLTNYSVQKTQFNFGSQSAQNLAGLPQESNDFNTRSSGWIGSSLKSGSSGSKLSLSNLRAALHQKYVSWDGEIWPQIKEIVLKTLVAGSSNNSIPYNPCAFELYGYDIIIDSNKKCWLIEVNSSPSLATDTQLDETIKRALIKDTINVLNPMDFDRKRLADVLLRRLNEHNNGTSRYNMRANSQQNQMYQMNRDLTYILNGKMPRQLGQMPIYPGNYEMISPSPYVDRLLQIINNVNKDQFKQ